MAFVARQPFAPLNETHLQNLSSFKNRQNALSPNSCSKRKASGPGIQHTDDFENVDPSQLSKRLKGVSSFFPNNNNNNNNNKSTVILTSKAASLTTTSPVAAFPRRSILNPKSPSKIRAVNKSSPLVPAGSNVRSPGGTKRSGGVLTSTRRRPASYSRIDPPRTACPAPNATFSLDAALKGTIPSYAARPSTKLSAPPPSSSSTATIPTITATTSALAAGKFRAPSSNDLTTGPVSSAWVFEIHEDTPEQEMTNLLQHSTCVLDISSDEETESKRRRETDEGRDKENIPPPDDISQNSSSSSRRLRSAPDEPAAAMNVDPKLEPRLALQEMDAKSFFPSGCDESSIFIVPADDEDDIETVVGENETHDHHHHHLDDLEVVAGGGGRSGETKDYVLAPQLPAEAIPLPAARHDELAVAAHDDDDADDEHVEMLKNVPSVDELMRPSGSGTAPRAPAPALQPVEGTRAAESFELWESGSAQDENEAPPPC